MQVATQAFAPVTRRFRPFLAGAFPASPLAHRPCLIFLLFHPLPCRTTLFATSWRCGTIVSYLARGQRLLWECILKQGAPRLSARGSSAGRGSFFPPTHPTTQGICAGGIGGAVPCRLLFGFGLSVVLAFRSSPRLRSVPLRCARVVVFFNCFERFGYCCDAASMKPQLLDARYCFARRHRTLPPRGLLAPPTRTPTNMGRRGGETGL
jgi:hypothetical protein